MTWQPINEANALDSTVWGVVLTKQLVQRHQQAIQANESVFEDVLPSKTLGTQLRLQVESSGNITVAGGDAAEQPAGLTYSRIAADGSVPLQLSISGRAVSVTNKSYAGWRKDKADALDAFARLSRALHDVSEEFPVSHLSLSYKDVFWWDGEWQSGCVSELLARDTKWTPKWMFEADSFWHHDIGEIVIHDDVRVVERLAIHCLEGLVNERPRAAVVMETTTRWLGKQPRDVLSVDFHRAFGQERSDVERCYDAMHDVAKRMFVSVLAEPMREKLRV